MTVFETDRTCFLSTRKSLIQRVASNCEDSWQELHLAYRGFIAAIALRAGVVDADVDDVVQAIFLEVHRDLNQDDSPDFSARSFGAWLGQKVKWRVGEYHRHRHRREHATDPADLVNHQSARPFDVLWDRDWQRRVLELAMQRVAEKPRNLFIFQALAVQEIPVEEVCSQFEISRTNADTIKKRVKDKLALVILEIEQGEI